MDAAKLAKVRAIAEDTRADPFTRSIAKSMLEAGTPVPPQPTAPRNPLHPGMRTTPEYERWKRAVKGKR